MPTKKGLFITIEGPDGTGKTTISKLVAKELTAKKISVIHTFEPGNDNSFFTKKIRDIILNQDSKQLHFLTLSLLFTAARNEHNIKIIHPALKRNQVIICDRYVDSSIVYQAKDNTKYKDDILKLNYNFIQATKPHHTFIIDVDWEIVKKRLQLANKVNNHLDPISASDYSILVKRYKNLMNDNPSQYTLIKNNGSINNCVNEIMEKILLLYHHD